ncbi:hypothetical protein BPAE_0127g00120 [Botrytis paeoniae]|uniref:Uncharacterized protein n=1 Tax=Botrytis paeoniae TaxID=278948 RepID=A0A4Z1FLA5_9HELO|nr:hypothetical protein BPAE_0127g00120 [Botrytis paeoniae]
MALSELLEADAYMMLVIRVNLLRLKALVTGATICSGILFVGQKFNRIIAMFYRGGGYRANFLAAQATPSTKNGAL